MDHKTFFGLPIANRRTPAKPLALGFDDVRQVVADTLADHLAFKLRKIDEHVTKESPYGRRGINVLRDTDEVAAVALEVLHEAVEIGDGTGQAVELVHDDIAHIALFDPSQHRLERRAVCRRAA